MKKIFPILVFTLIISSIVNAQVIPGDNWTYNENPELNGWNLDKMDNFRRYIIDSSFITGLLIIHKGEVIFEYGDLVENSYIASCRKSVLAMLYGQYVENGKIDLSKNIEQLEIDDVEGILPVEKKATIKDLISARSGVYHPEGYPGGMQEHAPPRGSVEPGSYWLYSNWDFNVAGYVFEKETGKNIYDEVQSQIAIPLNMQDWDRTLQKKEGDTTISKYLAYPMWFSTRDMARIGLLMLNRGKWNDQQIISETWIDEMLKQRTTFQEINNNIQADRDIDFGYGYMWWLWENSDDIRVKGAYAALGAMGQAIIVFPEIETVLVYKTKEAYRRSNSRQVRLSILNKVVDLYE